MQPSVHTPTTPTQSLEFYRSIVSKNKDLFSVIDRHGNYVFVSESAETIYGYKPSDMVGKSSLSFIHPNDQPTILACIAAVLAGESPQVPPFRYRIKSGEWRWIQSAATNMLADPHVQGILVNSRDVTEAFLLSKERDYHQAYYKSLFFEHPDTVFTLSNEGRFQRVNQHIQKLTGYNVTDLVDSQFGEIVHPDSIPAANEAYKRVMQGEAHTMEIRIITKQRQEKHISVSVMPVYFGGVMKGIQGIARDVTQATHTQLLIKEQAQQLNNILESISEPFYVLNSSWCFTFVSAAFASFMHKTREELAGKPIWELFPALVNTKLFRACNEVSEKRNTIRFEETYTKTYLQPCTLHFTLYPTVDGIAVHFVDVTESYKTQLELEKLSLVASKTINGVIIMGPDRRIDWVNDGFCRLTGYDRQEAIGLVPGELLRGPDTDPAVLERIRQKYKALQPFSEELLCYKKSGERIWLYIDMTPIFNEAGQLVNFVAIKTDISEKKEAEVKQLKLADDLFKQNRDLQQFTYIISHNLRAPVANALGLARLVNKLPKAEPAFDHALDKLHTSVLQLDSVIKDINNLLSIRDSGRVTPRELVNLNQVCREVLESFETEITQCRATFTIDINPGHSLFSIKAYLFSILHNLISNALKYRSEERPLEVLIKVEPDMRGYVLTVCDNGLGLDMQLVKHQLFQLYKRFHPFIHGKGTGLFLVKTQVEALGGKIKVDSMPDQGTTFSIYLGAKSYS
ncbi:PAS domain-containing sensor histidine kinase [Pontibacter akesuensis]|uniref:histidine kinase n=1 Tax=Pontibacter akesuensis TaxID=388950 RepID=A0A1I7GSU2_9BACT|nr:PAS domain-containing sensor histidine kinase [Pontibacter akesuensis]GHA55270.1 hypothetical protein GCM10007389_03400 [Pontibacter akesuensis]SFU51461.1 PAS domain S-box-containing protein [Pontibacter akesuensis]